MKFQNLKETLKDKMENIYFVYGNDSFLIDNANKLITKRAITNCEELNFQAYDENINLSTILDNAESFPFMSDYRVLLIKNQDYKIIDNKTKQRLTEYFDNPAKTSVLIFLFNEKNEFFKHYEDKAEVVDCDHLNNKSLQMIIARELQKNNKIIAVNDALKLIEYCSSDLGKLYTEINKLSYATDSEKIESSDIELNVTKTLDYAIYELTDSIQKNNAEKMLTILDDLFSKKVNSQIALYTIANWARKNFHIAVSKENDNALSKDLKVKEGAIRIIKNQTKNIKKMQLLNNLKTILNADYKIKAGFLSDTNAIYNIFFTVLKENSTNLIK
ncbi:MAG: DNA polymerase III subunit delta [Bacilli bacterium]